MYNHGYRRESFNSTRSGTSDEDMVEIAGATLDFSVTDDVPPLENAASEALGVDSSHGMYKCFSKKITSRLLPRFFFIIERN